MHDRGDGNGGRTRFPRRDTEWFRDARAAGWGDPAMPGPGRWRPPDQPRGGRPGSRHWPAAVITALCFHVFDNWGHASHLAHPRDVVAGALLLLGPVALAWRGRAPITVLLVSGAATIGFATLSTPNWTYAVAPVLALHSAVREGRRWSALLAAAGGFAAYLAVTWLGAGPLGLPGTVRPTVRDAVLTAFGLVLTAFIGTAARARAAYLAELTKARAERAKVREEQERRQAADERLRIARELHDVLGHHLSLINVQAGVGLHLMDNRPEQAREALSAIKTASAEALREVRAVLGVLRPEEEAAPRQPALGLDRLTDLTADAGLPVTTETVGTRRQLPAEVDRAAYRMVQEALTNVRRHAQPGVPATITVEYAPTDLHLTIRNDGPSPPAAAADEARPDDGGSGIAGMRARAASLGGTLETELLPGGGFRVSAVLPTGPAPPGERG